MDVLHGFTCYNHALQALRQYVLVDASLTGRSNSVTCANDDDLAILLRSGAFKACCALHSAAVVDCMGLTQLQI